MKKITCLVLTILILLSLTACNNSKNSPSNQTILYNLSEDPDTLDPQVANSQSAQIVISNIFEGLVKIDKDDNIIPGVAKSWNSNSDYTSFTFYLRDDTSWSDKNKTPVCSDDFVFGITRALSKETASDNAYMLFPIKNAEKVNSGKLNSSDLGISAPDSHTVVIDLEYSFSEFPRVLANPVAMPCHKEFFESAQGKYGIESDMTICNGPFKLQSKYGWSHNEDIYLLSNDGYNGYSKPVSAGIIFSIGEDEEDTSDTIKSFENNSIDAGPLDSKYLEEAKEKNFDITAFEDVTFGLCFNFQDSILSNLNIRKAFITCIDRDYVLKDIPENCAIANDIVMDCCTVDGKNYRNMTDSSLYIKESDNPSIYLEKGIKELKLYELPSITIICEDDPKVKAIANNMIELFNNKLGYYFNVNFVSSEKLNSKVEAGQYQIVLTSISANSNIAFDVLSIFKSNAPNNPCDIRDSYYDQMLKECELVPTDEKVKLLERAEKHLNDQAAFYPLYYKNRYFACAPNIKNVLFNKYNSGINFVDTVKTKK